MSFSIHGLSVARGIAIGRAVLATSSRMEVAHYFIEPTQVQAEIARVRNGRNAVVDELQRLRVDLPPDAPSELAALLDVHLLLLQDEMLVSGVKHWITDRLYNAEWALTTQLEIISRQFDEMEDDYLRERKADLEQVVERILRRMKGVASPVAPPPRSPRRQAEAGAEAEFLQGGAADVPLVLVHMICRRPTCCNSSKACSRASLPMWAGRPVTRPSWRAAWTFLPSLAHAAPASWCARTTG